MMDFFLCVRIFSALVFLGLISLPHAAAAQSQAASQTQAPSGGATGQESASGWAKHVRRNDILAALPDRAAVLRGA